MSDNSAFGEGVVRLGDTEIAEIDGTKIYLSDVERTAALDELIDQRLLALDALRQSLDQKDETRRRLAASRVILRRSPAKYQRMKAAEIKAVIWDILHKICSKTPSLLSFYSDKPL